VGDELGASLPVVQFLRMISPLSWAPIAVAVFGIGSRALLSRHPPRIA
jgi:NitT/TauT family transport system permease protein